MVVHRMMTLSGGVAAFPCLPLLLLTKLYVMRNLLLNALSAAFLLCSFSSQAQIWTEDFETDGEGTRYTSVTSFYTSSSDHFQRTTGLAPGTVSNANGLYTAFSGSYFWAGEDLDAPGSDGNTFKTLTFTGIDVTGIANLEFRGLFGGNDHPTFPGWDNNDDLYIEYQVDGGGYSTFLSFESTASTNGYMQHDSNLDGTGDGVLLSAAVQEINAFITGLSGVSLDIRIYVDADSGAEEFCFDHLRLFDAGAAGCTNMAACNYNAAAGVDDGSCVLIGDSCDDSNTATIQDVVQADCSCAGVVADLVMTEIMYNSDDAGGYTDSNWEFIEVYNAGTDAIVLDNFTFTGFTVAIPAASSIAPGEYVVFALTPASFGGIGAQVFDMGGALSNGGETLEIYDDNLNLIDAVTYNDVSPWPTDANGNGPALALNNTSDDNSLAASWHAYCVGGGMHEGSPGLANPGPLAGCTDPTALNYEPCAGTDDASCTYLFGPSDIVINELHYNPCSLQGTDDGFEFVELYNTTAGTIDIGDWYFANAITYTFPTGTMIGPGEYVVLCADQTAYSGMGFQVFEWGIGQALNNMGESVNLFDDTAQLIDLVDYDTSLPWAVEPNGGCVSLELIDNASENNTDSNWTGSLTFGGTPGTPNSVLGGYDCTDCGGGSSTQVVASDDFEAGLTNWTEGSVGDWTTSASDAIATTSLAHNIVGLGGSSYINTDLGCLELNEVCTTWNVDLKQQTGWTASAGNSISIVLAMDQADPSGANGYAVVMDGTVNTGNISLVRLDAGVSTSLIEAPLTLLDDQAMSLEVRHTEDGTWVLLIDTDGGADGFLAASSTSTDATYSAFRYSAIATSFDAATAGGLRIDNWNVSQCGTSETYYAVATGNSSSAIWNANPIGTGTAVTFSRFKTMNIQTGMDVTLDADHNVAAVVNDGTLNLGAQSLTTLGDFTNNSTLNANTGTVRFKGAANGIINGSSTSDFYQITLEKQNGASVTLASDARLGGLMAMESGSFDTGAQVFTLQADASGRGCIGEIKAAASFTGPVTFETYIPATTQQSYFCLGNPILGNTLTGWNDDMETTGFPGSDYPGWPTPVAPYINIYHYNETAPGDLNDNGWIPASNILNPLYTNNGYMLYLNSEAYTLDVTGNIQTGPVSDVVTHTVSVGPIHDGWNLITNPLPCDMTWQDVYNASSGIQPQYYVMDSDGIPGYKLYDGVSESGTASAVIAAGQSVWVKASLGGGTVVWTEAAKATTAAAYERSDDNMPGFALELDNGAQVDLAYVHFHNEALEGLDYLDGFKLFNGGDDLAQLSLAAGEYDMAVDYIPAGIEALTIPVNLKSTTAFDGSITIANTYELPEGYCFTLTDLVTGESMEVVEGASMAFSTEALDGTRFELQLGRVLEGDVLDAGCHGANDGQITVSSEQTLTYTWTDEMDLVIAETSGSSSVLSDLGMGFYTVTASDASGLCPAVSMSYWVDQPAQESFSTTTGLDACDLGEGWVSVALTNAPAFTYTLENDLGLVATGTAANTLELEGLVGETYELTVSTVCNTFSEWIDLVDPQAVSLELSAEDTVISLGDASQFVVHATSTNASEVTWTVNGTEAGNGSTLVFPVTEVGTYEVSAHAYNATCAASDYTLVQVQQATDVADLATGDFAVYATTDGVLLTPGNNVEGDFTCEVLSATGQLVSREQVVLTAGTPTVLHTDLAQGTYLIRIYNQNWDMTQRLALN